MSDPPDPDAAKRADDLSAPIVAERLRLVLIPADVLRAVTEQSDAAVEWPGVGAIASELTATMPAGMRARQIEADPDVAAWLLRGIVVSEPASTTGRRVAGHLGGHDRPDPSGMVEVGYTVAAADRRQGLAREGAAAWFAWAHRHGARTAQLSIEPGNAPSLAVARHLGLRGTRRVWDEDDQVWELVLTATLPLRAD
ncbi:MAG: GNAT family N-acetyltransferase [Acidimicrobiales bacterium]